MKIILLDIDGVLNSYQSSYLYNSIFNNEDAKSWLDYRGPTTEEFTVTEKMLCPMACSNLKLLLEYHPDVRIVISSTWRSGRSVERFNSLFKFHKIFTEDKVIGKTPCLNKQRGYEIQQWLDDNAFLDYEDFIILDDDCDMVHFLGTAHFLEINNKVGFDYLAMEKVDQYFGEFNLKFCDLEEGVPYGMYSKTRNWSFWKEGDEMVYYTTHLGHNFSQENCIQCEGSGYIRMFGAPCCDLCRGTGKLERRSIFFYPAHELFSAR